MSERNDRTPAALYARVSSDRQDVDLSVSAQLRALRDYDDKNDYEVVREFVDEAESGRVMNRPEFQKMLDEAKRTEAPFEEILVWKFSRFTRKREHAVVLKSMLRRKGLRVVSITEQAEDNPTGRAPRRHHRDRGRVLQRKFGDGSPAGYEGGGIPRLLGRSHGPLRLQEGQGAGRPPRRGPPWSRTPRRPASSSASSTWPRPARG